ncbi:hypothetical protein H351_32165 (plasmid) [Rhodococcus erythropolis R138]|uniref:hypothetical protein n=1 Tax=Rhodococcus erythropolis TaxID=1833 RepID=UPI0004A87522|nr:hypothetical protein [Rhodococcus erythropolis]ALU73754.1 hypothetical protein H351_32165 [Rhodococcus erythropolis R138]
MPRETHVQHCAALICAYITDDDEGCDTLRDTPGLTYQQWYISATILCATVLDLLAFLLDSHPLAVIEKYTPHRHAVFPGPRHLREATIAIVYFDLHQQVPAAEALGANVIPTLFDIAITAIEHVALLWGRPPVEVARVLTVAAATHEQQPW